MAVAMNQLASQHVGETIVLVSHGGPVTHLYKSVTGNDWNAHGQSKYCCFSIYQKEYDVEDDDSKDAKSNKWTPLIVNRTLWSDDDNESNKTNTKRQASFQWS